MPAKQTYGRTSLSEPLFAPIPNVCARPTRQRARTPGVAQVTRPVAPPRALAHSRDASTVAEAMHDPPGLRELWQRTRGDPAIRIAVLDGPVDLAHPCLVGAMLRQRTVTGSPARFDG